MKSSYKANHQPEVSSYETDDTLLRPENLPKAVVGTAKKQVIEEGTQDFWRQLLGSATNDNEPLSETGPKKEKPKKEKASASEGVILVDFKSFKKDMTAQLLGENPLGLNAHAEKKHAGHKEAGIEYHSEYYRSITKSGENLSRKEANEHKKQIEQIMAELRKLVTSTKALQSEFGTVTVEAAPTNPGKYYVNFFEWMLIMLRQARQRVEDSNSWLSAVQGKNSKKMGYWGKAKKLGTSFTQSNERNVATQTG